MRCPSSGDALEMSFFYCLDLFGWVFNGPVYLSVELVVAHQRRYCWAFGEVLRFELN